MILDAEIRPTKSPPRSIVSRKTAANYHYAIKAKLGASSDIELLYLGLRHGLIERCCRRQVATSRPAA